MLIGGVIFPIFAALYAYLAVGRTLGTVAIPFVLMFFAKPGSWVDFWTLFGASNQLLAALTLLSITVWLHQARKRIAFTLLPMLFVSGDRDALAELDLLRPVVKGLGGRGTLQLVRNADHSFKPAARSGRTAADIETEALDAVAEWMTARG